MSKLTLKQAQRWYDFGVGRITTDIDGTVCVRTLSGQLFKITDSEDRAEATENIGTICAFWIKKSDKSMHEFGLTNLNERLTESTSDLVWMNNFGYELGLAQLYKIRGQLHNPFT